MAYGFDVYLVDPKKSSRLRKALSDHVKSDRVDAEALARLLLMLPDKLDRLNLPTSESARLRDLVRHRDRLTESTSARKTRIVEPGNDRPDPTDAHGSSARSRRKFLERVSRLSAHHMLRSPVRSSACGKNRLHRFLDRRHQRCFDPERTEKIFRAADVPALNSWSPARTRHLGPSSIPLRSSSWYPAWSSISWFG